MSYNVSNMATISGGLTISPENRDRLISEFTDLPGWSFIEELDKVCNIGQPFKPIWHDEGSGRLFDIFTECLEFTEGSTEIVVTWESGDEFEGIRVVGGVVTRHKVVMTLGEMTE